MISKVNFHFLGPGVWPPRPSECSSSLCNGVLRAHSPFKELSSHVRVGVRKPPHHQPGPHLTLAKHWHHCRGMQWCGGQEKLLEFQWTLLAWQLKTRVSFYLILHSSLLFNYFTFILTLWFVTERGGFKSLFKTTTYVVPTYLVYSW